MTNNGGLPIQTDSRIPMKRPHTNGVVTFLDVLGWKGIYNRETDPIGKLTKLVATLEALAKQYRGNDYSPTLKSISDTIVICSSRVDQAHIDEVIEWHGTICAKAIAESIISHIPVRGATAVGDFEDRENIYVGRAIDEAAAWYECGDWIGVHLTPSAEFSVKNKLKIWTAYSPPLKNGGRRTIMCVNWLSAWREACAGKDPIGHLRNVFMKMGPIVPEIASKFTSTIDFVESLRG